MTRMKPRTIEALSTNRGWIEDIMWGNNLMKLRIVLPTKDIIEWVRGTQWGDATMTRIPYEEPVHDRTVDSGTSDS